MSYVSAVPEVFASASADLSGVGEAIKQATLASVPSTTGIAAAAEDEVSAAVGALFSAHGQQFQALSSQAAAFHAEFVQNVSAAEKAYANAEAAGAHALQSTLSHAAPAEDLNLSVSILGKTATFGDATTSAGPDEIAIAYGAHSSATATGGHFDIALAVGTNNSASARGGFDNIAVALGANNTAVAGGENEEFNFGGVLGGEFNTATAGGGDRNVALVQSGHDISAKAVGDRIVSIEPKGAPLNLSISADGDTLFQSGAAHTSTRTDGAGFAVAYGNNSYASADGYGDRGYFTNVALAIGNGDKVTTFGGANNFAIALGTNNIAAAIGNPPTGSLGFGVAAVLSGTGNDATTFGTQDISLVLGGDGNKAFAGSTMAPGDNIAAVLSGTGNKAQSVGKVCIGLVLSGNDLFANAGGFLSVVILPKL